MFCLALEALEKQVMSECLETGLVLSSSATHTPLPLPEICALQILPARPLKMLDFSTSDSNRHADGKLATGQRRALERRPRNQTDVGSQPALSFMIRVGPATSPLSPHPSSGENGDHSELLPPRPPHDLHKHGGRCTRGRDHRAGVGVLSL